MLSILTAARVTHWFKLLLCGVFCVFSICAWGVSSAYAQSTTAEQVFVYDMSTDSRLYAKNADDRMAPSSMTKIMTAYVVFDAVKNGEIQLNDKIRVSNTAYRRGGSKMFLLQNERATVLDLLKGLIIVSGNDAAITLAEGVSGSEAAFADRMNATAQALGMRNSNFVNASGWPDDNHYSTARDIAILSVRLITDHPDFYHGLFSEREMTHNAVTQYNRNKLLTANFNALPENFLAADGIKTGFTSDGGYGLAASAVDIGGRRVVTVMNGLSSKSAREVEGEALMAWAFTEFQYHEIFRPGQIVGYAPVWLGQQNTVALHTTKGLRVTLPIKAFDNLKAELIYQGPIEAPVYVDQQVGYIQIAGPGIDPIQVPVVAGESIDSVGRFEQVIQGLQYSVFGVQN